VAGVTAAIWVGEGGTNRKGVDCAEHTDYSSWPRLIASCTSLSKAPVMQAVTSLNTPQYYPVIHPGIKYTRSLCWLPCAL